MTSRFIWNHWFNRFLKTGPTQYRAILPRVQKSDEIFQRVRAVFHCIGSVDIKTLQRTGDMFRNTYSRFTVYQHVPESLPN